MRKREIIFFILVFSGLCGAQIMPRWAEPENWQKIQPRMTMLQVSSLLGNPLEKIERTTTVVWCYQESPKTESGRVSGLPETGYVRFKTVSVDPVTRNRLQRPMFVVVTFAEPDWENIHIPESAKITVYTNKESEEERQQKAEEHRLKMEALRLEIEKGRAEAQKLQEERAREFKESLAAKQPEPEPLNKQTLSMGRAYYFILGGVLAGLGLAVGVYKAMNN